MKKHAKYSASSAHRWMECAGSIKLIEQAPPQAESKYALEGTRAHECLEKVLKAKHPRVTASRLINEYGVEMVNHALTTLREVEKRTNKHAEVLIETQVDLSFIAPEMFGTLDVGIVDEFGTLHVIDYKYGAGVSVSPEKNPQLMYYALGLAHKYSYNFKDVALVIVQPRAAHADGTIREWRLSPLDLADFAVDLEKAVSECEKEGAPLKAGRHCKFCPAAVICPEISKNALQKVKAVFAPEKGELILPQTEMIPIPFLGQTLEACEKLENWISEVRGHAYHILEKGGTVDGYKLVPKRSTRKWINQERVEKLAFKKFGKKAFTSPELLSPAQIEKVTGDKDFVASHVTDVSSGLTLVRADDKRTATNKVDSVFKTIN